MTTTTAPPVGRLLRDWRRRRRLSQLDLAIAAEISTRHLSFVETGRSRPTSEMIIRLTEQLDVPLRERNQVLLAGGYAPAYPEHALDDPELATVRDSVHRILQAHVPFPALVFDRWWNVLDANNAIGPLLSGCARHLLEAPVNVMRLSLHPQGMAPRIANLAQWRGHLLGQLRQRIARTDDERLHKLAAEVTTYAGGEQPPPPGTVVLPLRLRHGADELSLFSVASRVDTATDVTVDELVVETFYPADEATASILRDRSTPTTR